MKKQTPETALKRAAAKMLWDYYKIPTWAYPGGVMGTNGFPDRIGILKNGQFLAIEFKRSAMLDDRGRMRPQGELSEKQLKVKEIIEAAGGVYIVCRKLEDLIEGLNLPGRLW